MFDEIVEAEGIGDGARSRARDLLPPKILRMGANGRKPTTGSDETDAEDTNSVHRWTALQLSTPSPYKVPSPHLSSHCHLQPEKRDPKLPELCNCLLFMSWNSPVLTHGCQNLWDVESKICR